MFDIRVGILAGFVVSLLTLAACTPAPDVGSSVMISAAPGQARAETSLAVSHAFTLRVDSREVETVQQKDLAACRKLGCKVLSTRLDRSTEGRVFADTSVRIAPEAYPAFAAAIAAPPAEIISHSESAEDKTLPILDVEKRLEVKSALRDRLLAMLRDPGSKSAADLAAIEKELAAVQGDIEAARAQRDFLRTITETVKVDIRYSGIAAKAGGVDLTPIDHAIKGIGQTLVASVAALISFVAALVPWSPLILLVVWGTRRGLRRWKGRGTSADWS